MDRSFWPNLKIHYHDPAWILFGERSDGAVFWMGASGNWEYSMNLFHNRFKSAPAPGHCFVPFSEVG